MGRCAADPSDAACALVVWFWSLVAGAPCHGRLTLAGLPPVALPSRAMVERARRRGLERDKTADDWICGAVEVGSGCHGSPRGPNGFMFLVGWAVKG